MAPTTVIARWTRCNTQSAVPALAAAINKAQQGVTATGRWTVQARSFRLPSSSTTAPKGTVTSRVGGLSNEKEADDGRSMVVVRASTSEVGYTFIEDPAAPLRAAQGAAPHTRTTTSTLSATAPSFPFDMLLGRVLCLPPNAGTPGVGAWIPRTSHLLIDGYAFTVGQTGAVAGDWVVRIGGVQIKGGAAGGRGCVVEATYLPVSSLPPDSQFIHNFIATLFPAAALAAGDITWLVLEQDTMYEAGLSGRPVAGAEEDAAEWSELHSALTYVTTFRQEGLL